MAIKGSLKEAGLADVCQLLSIGRKTGCLSITDRSRFGQVYFDRGRITFAMIVNRRDRIGDILVRDGAIDHAQLMDAVDAQKQHPDRRLGELLLAQGHIDADTLNACIRHQIEEAIYYLFAWRRGNFHFEPDRRPAAGEVLISVDPETLLLEGARRIDEWSIIQKKITSNDLIFIVDRPRLEATAVQLTTEQQALVPHIDGRRTVIELSERTSLDEFATGKALYGLMQAGFARPVGRRDRDADVTDRDSRNAFNLGVAFFRTAMLEDAEREFRRVLQDDPRDTPTRQYLALIALRQGDPVRAGHRLTALLETDGPRIGVFLNLSVALRLQGRFQDAARALREAGQLAPRDPRVRLAQAATALFGGDAATAVRELDEYRALLSPPATLPATYYYCAGLAETVQGRRGRAVELVDEGLGTHPDSAPLHLLRGIAAEAEGDRVTAESAYRRAAEEDPLLAQAHRNLGDMARERHAPQEALEHYTRAVEVNPELGDGVYTRMAELYYRRNERDRAIACWRRAIELNPGNEAARNHLDVVARAAR